MEQDAQLDRVRKLLAMAEAEELTEAARESYNAKAAELIAQYGIDQAMVEDSQERSAVASDVLVSLNAPYARDKLTLLAAVAVPLNCRTVHRDGYQDGRRIHQAHLFGMPADLERTQLLFTSLLLQSAHGLLRVRAPRGEDMRAYRRSWLGGFSVAVHLRLSAAEEAARARADAQDATQTSGRSTALVLADRRGLVAQHVAATYPKLRTPRTRSLSGSGGRAGYDAGERANLGGTSLDATSRRALSH